MGLIIRNLSFKCLPQTLERKCQKFGSLFEIIMPTTTNGKHRGFAFIQFKSPKDAKNALQGLNKMIICGRSIICDWALEKKSFEKKLNSVVQTASETKEKNKNKRAELTKSFSESLFLESINDVINSETKNNILKKNNELLTKDEIKIQERNINLLETNKNIPNLF